MGRLTDYFYVWVWIYVWECVWVCVNSNSKAKQQPQWQHVAPSKATQSKNGNWLAGAGLVVKGFRVRDWDWDWDICMYMWRNGEGWSITKRRTMCKMFLILNSYANLFYRQLCCCCCCCCCLQQQWRIVAACLTDSLGRVEIIHAHTHTHTYSTQATQMHGGLTFVVQFDCGECCRSTFWRKLKGECGAGNSLLLVTVHFIAHFGFWIASPLFSFVIDRTHYKLKAIGEVPKCQLLSRQQ